jgi:hypothetical protein
LPPLDPPWKPGRRGRWPETFDDSDEARWGPGEVLSHLAEMVPYWLGEIERVLAGDPSPCRSAGSRPTRCASPLSSATGPCRRASYTTGIDGDLSASTGAGGRCRRPTSPDAGLHPSRGELTVAAMPERFIVGHLADHVRQLEEILAGPDAGHAT